LRLLFGLGRGWKSTLGPRLALCRTHDFVDHKNQPIELSTTDLPYNNFKILA